MNLESLRKLCDAATPGPWRLDERIPEWDGDGSYSIVVPHLGEQMLADDTRYYPTAPPTEDARFIAAARTALPLLLAVAEAARGIPSQPSPAHRLLTPGWDELNAALAALEAAP